MTNWYAQTESILRSDYHPPDRLAALLKWINDKFQVEAINVSFGTAGYHQGMGVILKSTPDAQKLYDPSVEASTTIAEWYYQNLYPFVPNESELAHGDFVTPVPGKRVGLGVSFYAMEAEVCKQAFAKATFDLGPLKEKYHDLIEKVVKLDTEILLFFFTEAQQTECWKNGTTNQILEELAAPLKSFDEFNLLTGSSLAGCIRIDNKENYDTNYGGQMWMYMR